MFEGMQQTAKELTLHLLLFYDLLLPLISEKLVVAKLLETDLAQCTNGALAIFDWVLSFYQALISPTSCSHSVNPY